MTVIENILFEVLYNLQVLMSHVGYNVRREDRLEAVFDILFCDII